MAWYVFALTDSVPEGPAGRGLAAPIAFRPVGGLFAAVERRADVPPIELGSLRSHQEVVERLAADSRAILPVRFGTLLTSEEIEEVLEDREDELSEALAFVRGRCQMTWRLRTPHDARRSKDRSRGDRPHTTSGAEYLRNALRATKAAPPAIFRRIRDGVGRLAAAERYQEQTPGAPAALYHLVDRARVDAYRMASKRLQNSAPTLTLSGPWAPYAFVPELF